MEHLPGYIAAGVLLMTLLIHNYYVKRHRERINNLPRPRNLNRMLNEEHYGH